MRPRSPDTECDADALVVEEHMTAVWRKAGTRKFAVVGNTALVGTPDTVMREFKEPAL